MVGTVTAQVYNGYEYVGEKVLRFHIPLSFYKDVFTFLCKTGFSFIFNWSALVEFTQLKFALLSLTSFL